MNATADGLAARMYVRGGLSPFYADEVLLNTTVRMIMSGSLRSTALLDRAGRAHVAAQLLAGWSTHRDAERPADRVVWHRYMAGTRISVGSAS